MDKLVVALPGAVPLAAGLAMSLRCDWTELALHTFPDGEKLVRIDAPVRGRNVLLAGSLHHPDGKTLPLLFAADAARELGAVQVGLVAPYLSYMRQDHRFKPGEAITSRSYARLLSSCLDYLVTVDPHLHRWHTLEEVYGIPHAGGAVGTRDCGLARAERAVAAAGGAGRGKRPVGAPRGAPGQCALDRHGQAAAR